MTNNHALMWSGLKFLVDTLKGLRVSRNLELSAESFCVSTGTESENWVYFPEQITSLEQVNNAVKFFSEHEEAFMWPVYSGGRELLERAGLIYAGDITAMMLNPENVIIPGARDDVKVLRSDSAEEWAYTSWRGFGGGADDLPENYCEFVKALDAEERVSLYSAKYDGKNAGVFMLTNEREAVGVYYFAVVPEFRRKGIARAMMSEICRYALSCEGKSPKMIILQSSPMGHKFYSNFGFTELFKIPVYSTDSDIL